MAEQREETIPMGACLAHGCFYVQLSCSLITRDSIIMWFFFLCHVYKHFHQQESSTVLILVCLWWVINHGTSWQRVAQGIVVGRKKKQKKPTVPQNMMNLNTKQLFAKTDTSVGIPIASFVLIFDFEMQREGNPCPLSQWSLRRFISGTKNKRGGMEKYGHSFFFFYFVFSSTLEEVFPFK